mmetsp:Transcript_18422/g.42000  ORF Transcript_18422/g.42000 Transcript_18422/m.42000 type:complete len:208 (-) Transcript_18422:1659-2282(-)
MSLVARIGGDRVRAVRAICGEDTTAFLGHFIRLKSFVPEPKTIHVPIRLLAGWRSEEYQLIFECISIMEFGRGCTAQESIQVNGDLSLAVPRDPILVPQVPLDLFVADKLEIVRLHGEDLVHVEAIIFPAVYAEDSKGTRHGRQQGIDENRVSVTFDAFVWIQLQSFAIGHAIGQFPTNICKWSGTPWGFQHCSASRRGQGLLKAVV